jgi:hypothetical protein
LRARHPKSFEQVNKMGTTPPKKRPFWYPILRFSPVYWLFFMVLRSKPVFSLLNLHFIHFCAAPAFFV